MEYVIDPKSGNRLSRLGFGCMRFAGNQMVHSFGLGKKPDYEKTRSLILTAIENGVNYFDTAYIYTGSEEVLGKVLQENGLRDRVFIADKIPLMLVHKPSDLETIFQKQLTRLGTGRIDYFLFHMLSDVQSWQKFLDLGAKEWLEAKKAAGQIGQAGFSFHGTCQNFEELLDAYDWDFCQIQYNYSNENFQAGRRGLQKAYGKGLLVMIMEPLLGGKLTALPEEGMNLLKRVDANLYPAAFGLNWLYNQKEVGVVLSGMNEMQQVMDNIHTASHARVGMLSRQDLQVYAAMREIFARNVKIACTGCQYCMPCGHGVNIPNCFAAYNTRFAHSKNTGFLQYVNSTLLSQKKGSASQCVGCKVCESRCPQKLPISSLLAEVAGTMETPLYKVCNLGMDLLKKLSIKR